MAANVLDFSGSVLFCSSQISFLVFPQTCPGREKKKEKCVCCRGPARSDQTVFFNTCLDFLCFGLKQMLLYLKPQRLPLLLLQNEMENSPDRNNNTRVYYVKNLNIKGAALLLKEKLEDLGFQVVKVVPGKLIMRDALPEDEEKLSSVLEKYGFEIIRNRDLVLVEEIKQAVIELIHYMNNMDSVVRKKEYIVEKLGRNYNYLSRLFSTYEPLTLEKYIIEQKIERIKELIDEGELTLSEISYLMDYSSVHYLSNQFKKMTGYSVTEYKNRTKGTKRFWDEIEDNAQKNLKKT